MNRHVLKIIDSPSDGSLLGFPIDSKNTHFAMITQVSFRQS